MSSPSKQPRSGQTSINYRCNPIKAPPSELADIVHEKYACPHSNDNKQNNKNSEPNSEKILSTTELISAVDKIWNCASHLHIFHPKADGLNDHSGYKKEILGNLGKEENGITRLFADEEYFSVDISSGGQLTSLVKLKLEFPKVTRKLLAIDSCSERYTPSTFSRFLQGCLPSETFSARGLVNEGIYQWMTDISPSPLKFTENSLETENTTADKHGVPGGTIGSSGHSILGDRHNFATGQVSNDIGCCLDSVKSDECSSCCSSDKVMNVGNTRSLHSDYFLRDDYDTVIDNSRSRTLHSSLYADYSMDSVASCNIACDKFQHLNGSDVLLENRRRQPEKFIIEDEKGMELGSLQCEKHQFSFAKQEHAFAGAMAGVFVSLCLHPVDTIKTVVQSCNAGNKSVCDIGKSIISERGLPGLYRGIASNIASSAPISAVYTFTYESVKGSLLPHFPKEFHSLAHCIAGGCASIATSFIFTPSERIKQQMQVGSHYHNCWNALVGILGKGGLPSLYAGWGAVLCRNVPHSIIKFYTYESLKQIMLPLLGSSAQVTPLQTLVCGGLAGSTAALFTTPFDVVKTRLQTQIPGSLNRYDNVYHALGEIGKNEGLRGLYRGLIPRLVMYMSQGALFFASYEFFKSLFSLEVSRLNAARIQCKQNEEDAQLTQ